MDCYEIYFTSHPAEPELTFDLLAAVLADVGFDTFMPDAGGLRAYIPAQRYSRENLERQLRHFPLKDADFSYTQTLIPDQNWNEEWEKHYFQPLTVENRCFIRAPFHPPGAGFEYEIVIHPKMAFGTGHHETTYLMLGEILELNTAGCDVLDMGCGTALLAILAAKKGAAHVTAVDFDEWAYRNATENCALNGVDRVRVIQGCALAIPQGERFHFVFANINRNTLLDDIPLYSAALHSGGTLLLSGFYTEDVPLIESRCKQNGLNCCHAAQRSRWALIKTEKI
jgi:ribosomal protein L11 methyltransferase